MYRSRNGGRASADLTEHHAAPSSDTALWTCCTWLTHRSTLILLRQELAAGSSTARPDHRQLLEPRCDDLSTNYSGVIYSIYIVLKPTGETSMIQLFERLLVVQISEL